MRKPCQEVCPQQGDGVCPIAFWDTPLLADISLPEMATGVDGTHPSGMHSSYRPQQSWGKVIFSEACVKNSVYRGVVPGLGGCLVPGACLVWGCLVLGGAWSWGIPRPTTKGEIEEGSGLGPQPRGKLRRIWSRPTTKGEIEGDLVQAHTQGGS